MEIEKHNFGHLVIGGIERSGTSLVRAVLGSHPDIAIYQWDLMLWTKFYNIYKNKTLNENDIHKVLDEVLNHPKTKNCDVDFSKNYFLKKLDKLDSVYFEDVYEIFLKYYSIEVDKGYVGLKTPFNEFYSEDIFTKFPKTKFIHVIRNPLNVAVSLQEAKKKWWGGKVNFYFHIRSWKKSTQLALKNKKRYKDQYFILKYEDFVNQPKTLSKELCDFLEVPFDEEMLKMKGHPGWKGNNSSFNSNGKVNPKIQSGNLNKFENHLKSHTKKKYFYLLKDLLKKLEYDWRKPNFNSFESNIISLQFNLNSFLYELKYSSIQKIQSSKIYHPVKKLSQLLSN